MVGRVVVSCAILLSLMLAVSADAQEEVLNELLAGLGPGIGARAGAMGDAYVSVAEDASAMYWNPAGLAVRPCAHELHWATVRHGSSDLAFTDLGVVLDVVNGEKLRGNRFNFLASLADDRVFVEASAMAGYRDGRWAFGAYAQALAASDITLPEEDRVHISSWGMDTTTVGVAYADSLGDRLRWGVNVGKIYGGRGYANGDVLRGAGGEPINQVAKNTEHAEAWILHAGLIYLPDNSTRIGLVGRNLIPPTLTFDGMDPVTPDPSFDLGVSWRGADEDLTLAADIHNVTESNYVHSKLCLGAEARLSDHWLARVGLNDRTLFAGAGLQSGSFQLDIGFGADPTEHLMVTIRTLS